MRQDKADFYRNLKTFLRDGKGKRKLFVTLRLDGENIIGCDFKKEDTKYLNTIGMSPEDPLNAGTESFVNTFHCVLKKKEAMKERLEAFRDALPAPAPKMEEKK